MARFSIDFNGTLDQPLVSGKPRESLEAVVRLLKALGSGQSRTDGVTLSLRNDLVKASATATCAAVQVGDTVTINGTALTATSHTARGTVTCTSSGIDVDDTLVVGSITLTAKQHHAKGTITCSSADAADNVTVGATTFVGTTGAVTPGAATYSVDTGDTEAAASLAAQINAHAVASTVVTASSALGVVTLRAVASGVAGNSIVLTSTDGTDLAVSGAGTLSGATAPAAGEFDISGTDAQTATSVAAAINANATLAALVETAVASNVVHIKALATGTGGNSIALTSSDAQLAVSGSGTLAGGAAVANNQFDFHANFNTKTATALAAAINASTTAAINTRVTATSAAAVVTVSAVHPGIVGNNVTFVSSDGTRLAVTGSGKLASGSETLFTFSL